MTKEERHLWYDFFKVMKIQAHRQKPIGPYIVDFYIHTAKLVIELDGDQHGEPEHLAKDEARDEWLRRQGMTVLRYPNSWVDQSFEEVCQDILAHLPGVAEPEIE